MSLPTGEVNFLVDYAMSLVGIPYIYGGNNPLQGFDCSGLVCEILRSAGVVEHDHSAQTLHEFLKANGAKKLQTYRCGGIAFFGKTVDAITHCAFVLNTDLMIEAGGGDSTTKYRRDAEDKGAFVRMRPISRRHDLVDVLMPSYKLNLFGG